MPPKIHLVRHAQGFHNLCQANHTIHDPLLTEEGKQQCQDLQKHFPYKNVDLVVSSPIRRTIYTSLLSFKDMIKAKGLTILALPEIQETSDLPCDTGSSPEDLTKEFANKPVDFSFVRHGWNVKKGKWAQDEVAIAKRSQEAREWLRQRPESEIVVVTHGGLLHYLTDDWTDKDKHVGTGWANTEFRSYEFDPARSEGAYLMETEDSKRRRVPKPMDHNEITQLKRTMSNKSDDKA